MKGAEPDLSSATFQIYDETHTIGNAIRWMLNKKFVSHSFLLVIIPLRPLSSPMVEFCGYRYARFLIVALFFHWSNCFQCPSPFREFYSTPYTDVWWVDPLMSQPTLNWFPRSPIGSNRSHDRPIRPRCPLWNGRGSVYHQSPKRYLWTMARDSVNYFYM